MSRGLREGGAGIKRAACIHDLCGMGRCSLSVALPVLSAMGVQCCPMPTALLSAHTDGFGDISFLDLTDELLRIIAHWRSLGFSFDAVYAGYLGSARQIEIAAGFIKEFRTPETLVLIDPVMGDNGKIYKGYTPEMCGKLPSLLEFADVITPNVTEAALLLGEEYRMPARDEAESWCRRLSLNGRRSVVLTGVLFEEGEISCCVFDKAAVAAVTVSCKFEGVMYPGTGDLFSSVLLCSLLRGNRLFNAVSAAAEFVAGCVRETFEAGAPVREGVLFERRMKLLTEL